MLLLTCAVTAAGLKNWLALIYISGKQCLHRSQYSCTGVSAIKLGSMSTDLSVLLALGQGNENKGLIYWYLCLVCKVLLSLAHHIF